MSVQAYRIRLCAWLGLLAITSVAADEGGDFSNNLFSDLSPLLALFGERVTMQFMSESMSWADNIILAMAPLGIITIMISAIRVGGPSWLKAVVGRARENLAAAEVDLMSSTSHEVCELWNGREVVRCMGATPVTEFICLLPDDDSDDQPLTGQVKMRKNLANLWHTICKKKALAPGHKTTCRKPEIPDIEIKKRDEVFHEIGDTSKRADNSEASHCPLDEESIGASAQSQPRQGPCRINERAPQKISITRNRDDGSPNVSLNIQGHSRTPELIFAAISGTLLQLGVLVYAGFITYYPSLKFTKDDKPVSIYAYPCTTAGTILLVSGIALCAHVVESSTREKTWEAKDKRRRIRVVWLQQHKTVSDQTFKSYIIYAKQDQTLIKTSRRYERDENGYTFYGVLHEIFSSWIRTTSSIPKHLYQFGQDPTRLWKYLEGKLLRNRTSKARCQHQDDKAQAKKHHAILAIKTVIGTAVTLSGFILQFIGLRGMHWSTSIAQLGAVFVMVLLKAWLRRGLARPPEAKELTPGFELDWLAKTLGRDDYADFGHWGGEGQKKDGGDTQTAGDCGNRTTASDGITTPSEVAKEKNDASNVQPPQSSAQAIFLARKKLGALQEWRSIAYEEALCLSKAVEVTMNALSPVGHSGTALLTVEPWEWQLSVICGGSEETIGLRLFPEGGSWRVDNEGIEAVLSLWLSSVHEENQKNEKPGEHSVKDNPRASAGDAPPPHKDGKDQDTRLKMSAACHAKRPLGLCTSDLKRDIEWWVPRDLLHISELEPNHQELLRAGSFELLRTGSFGVDACSGGGTQDEESETDSCISGSTGDDESEIDSSSGGSTRDDESAHYTDTTGLLAMDFRGSLKILCAQELFTSFMRAVASKLRGPVFGGVDELEPEMTVGDGDWKKFKLRNNKLSQMVQDIHATGLGTVGEIYARVVTPLSQEHKLPETDKVVEWARERAEEYARLESWNRTQDALEWLFRVAETPSTVARARGILMDHLRRVLLNIKFRERQKYEEELSTLTKLRDTLINELSNTQNARQQLTNSNNTDLMRLFDYGANEEQRLLLGMGARTHRRDTCARLMMFPEIFNVTQLHYEALCDGYCFGHYSPRRDESEQELANSRDIFDRTPAHYASGSFIQTLKKCGADLDARDLLHWTPLHYACWTGNTLATKLLVQYGVRLNHQTKDGATPLHYAASQGSTEGVRMLVEAGAMVDIRDYQGNAPIHLAAYGGYEEVVSILSDNGSPNIRDHFGRTALHQAALSGEMEVIHPLIISRIPMEAKDYNGQTPLSLAIRMGHPDCVRLLLNNQADMKSRDEGGETPLHWAARLGHSKCLDILLEKSADVNLRNKSKMIPLHWAAESGHLSCVGKLIEGGADVNSKDGWHMTPLHKAAGSGHWSCVKTLLENHTEDHAEIDSRDGWNMTPLHRAAGSGHLSCVEELLEKGADVNSKDKRGDTPLHRAAESGHLNCVEELLEKGAEVESRDEAGETPLHKAVYWGESNIVRALLQNKADVNSIAHQTGRTPLMKAAEAGHTGILEMLLEQGADDELEDKAGMTALHHAVGRGHAVGRYDAGAVDILLELRFNKDAREIGKRP